MRTAHRARWVRAMIGGTLLALSFVAPVSSAPTAASIAPGAVLDQSNSYRPATCGHWGWAPDTANSWIAQTFTVGVSGLLTDVVVHAGGTIPQFTVSIAPVDAAGAPVITKSLAAAGVLLPFGGPPGNDVTASFGDPTPVDGGSQYAIVLTAPGENIAGGSWVDWYGDLGSSFYGCADGAYAGGRAWAQGTKASLDADADFFFEAYIVPTEAVTVQRSGSGSGIVRDGTGVVDCGAKCSARFRKGDVVRLTALPNADSTFGGWSGGCSGTSPTCALTVRADVTVSAIFARRHVTLTVRKIGSGNVSSRPAGIDCGRRCRFAFSPGPVVLTARPAAGWRFAGWRGACHRTLRSCHLTLGRSATVTARFALLLK